MNQEPLLSASGLIKRYRGRAVVNGVGIVVRPGEIVGLLGPNGAGKTTTFNMIVGLIRPDEGHIEFGGERVDPLPMHQRARRGMGYLTQEPSVFRKLSVRDNVMAILETRSMSSERRHQRLQELLAELDLTELSKSPAYVLSGGEKRRLEITRALAAEPSLLLLDEPFSGIDPIAVFEVQKILRRLRDSGMTVLITDHNVRETLKLVDRAYLIHQGRTLVEGTADFLVRDENAREIYLGPDFAL